MKYSHYTPGANFIGNFTCSLFYDSFNIHNINILNVTDFVFFSFTLRALVFVPYRLNK